MARFSEKLKHAFNVFFGRDAPDYNIGPAYSQRPDVYRLTRGNAKSLVSSIYNKIATDCAAVAIHHVVLDDQGRFSEFVQSGLEDCLTLAANIDQTGRAFLNDLYLSLLDEGSVAIVPIDIDVDDMYVDGYDILSLRVGRVVQWYPQHVRVEVFHEPTGQKKEITLPKTMVAIPENPFRTVMNEPNSTLKRLQRKLALIDLVDERTSSGKMDMIIQVPYSSKTDMQKKHAESRREALEQQLSESKYGIAWMDGTEKITQLSRPIENNLLEQINSLRDELYAQLGISKEVFDGTASEQVMLNYNNRTLEPIISAVVDEMKRKFISRTARIDYKMSIMFFREPFKLVPVGELAKIADVLTRNAILSSNELRGILGFRPSEGERADELINNNMPDQDIYGTPAVAPGGTSTDNYIPQQNYTNYLSAPGVNDWQSPNYGSVNGGKYYE